MHQLSKHLTHCNKTKMQQPKYIWTLDKASNCESHRDATRENIIPETEMKKLSGQKRILKRMLK